MRTQISPQIRIFALVGVLLIALAGSGILLLHRTKPGAATVPTTARSTTPAQTTATTPARTTTTPATQPHVRAVQVDPQLPAPVRAALARHRTVVVELYDPQVHVQQLSLAEARAGAAEAHAGYVQLNLLDDRLAGRLTALLPAGELLPSPGFLVYRFPGKLVYQFDGYLDRDAVALVAEKAK